jgi:hypothetical protein
MVFLGGIASVLAATSAMPASPVMTDLTLVTNAGVHHRLRVEVARTEEERLRGLMDRTALAEESGMLFVYPQAQSIRAGFWMYRTRFPLDIAFLDRHGTILAIRNMQPCASLESGRCPSYHSSSPYAFALEVNGGYFAHHGIAAGDRAQFHLPVSE